MPTPSPISCEGSESQLKAAIEAGNALCVSEALEHGARINEFLPDSKKHETPLIMALRLKQNAVLEVLLAHPELDVNLMNRHGESPLLVAVWAELTGMITALEERGADLAWKDRDGWNLLAKAISWERLESAKTLIRAGLDANGDSGPERHPVLAVNSVAAIDFLLEAGAELNSETTGFVLDSFYERYSREKKVRPGSKKANAALMSHLVLRGGRSSSLFLEVVMFADHLALEALLTGGLDPNTILGNGDPIVFRATDSRTLELFIEAGADLRSYLPVLREQITQTQEVLESRKERLEYVKSLGGVHHYELKKVRETERALQELRGRLRLTEQALKSRRLR